MSAGPALHHAVERLLDKQFGAGIDGACGFVKDERVAGEHNARDA